jgi:hypothetical protein
MDTLVEEKDFPGHGNVMYAEMANSHGVGDRGDGCAGAVPPAGVGIFGHCPNEGFSGYAQVEFKGGEKGAQLAQGAENIQILLYRFLESDARIQQNL